MAGTLTSTIPLLAYAAPKVNGAGEVVVALRTSGRVIRLVGPRGMWLALARDLLGRKTPAACAPPASEPRPPATPRPEATGISPGAEAPQSKIENPKTKITP
jgi:hypothetical protein